MLRNYFYRCAICKLTDRRLQEIAIHLCNEHPKLLSKKVAQSIRDKYARNADAIAYRFLEDAFMDLPAKIEKVYKFRGIANGF